MVERHNCLTLQGVGGRGGGAWGTICDFSADYPREHSVRILGSILFWWLANIFLIWSRQDYLTHFEPSQS